MILTESQAKGKVCPLMSHQYYSEHSRTNSYPVQCHASGCMKWRWMENHSPEEIASRKEFKMPTPEEPKGYCGA